MFDYINELGRKREPFFFAIDFYKNKFKVYPLSDCPEDIRFTCGNFSVNSPVEHVSQNISLNAIQVVSKSMYKKAFQLVQEEMKSGNTYLLNLTFPSVVEISSNLASVYEQSIAKFKCLLDDEFLSFSPERFIKMENNTISTYPMKGTTLVSEDLTGENLMNSQKESAEHLMIVDLLRNDLNCVAQNVEVSKFRYLDKVNTGTDWLWQTSSELVGTIPNWEDNIGTILDKLLPAGSVSGTPKPRTVSIIKDVEQDDRGFYTGVFGYFDGTKLDSGVLIRYIEKRPDGTHYYRSGGGITIQSELDKEYQELQDKIYLPLSRDQKKKDPSAISPVRGDNKEKDEDPPLAGEVPSLSRRRGLEKKDPSELFSEKRKQPISPARGEYDRGFLKQRGLIWNGRSLPYNPKLQIRAKALRNHMTEAEKRLWSEFLKKDKFKFYKQRMIDNYIVDFYCSKLNTIIEVDGSQHYTEDGLEYDKIKDNVLGFYKLNILRFTNKQILNSFDSVIQEILSSPNRGGAEPVEAEGLIKAKDPSVSLADISPVKGVIKENPKSLEILSSPNRGGARRAEGSIQLFETIKVINGEIQNLDYHLARISYSRNELFGFPDRMSFSTATLPEKGIYRVKVVYGKDIEDIEIKPYVEKPIKTLKIVHSDIEYDYKYLDRTDLNNLYAQKGAADDVLIIKDGLVTDTTIANTVFYKAGQWYTPSTPILMGTKRAKLIEEGSVKVQDIKLEDINSFEKVGIINALRDICIIENVI